MLPGDAMPEMGLTHEEAQSIATYLYTLGITPMRPFFLLISTCHDAQLAALAQKVPEPVPANEVFTREEIGHALAAPTPEAGHTVASARQRAGG